MSKLENSPPPSDYEFEDFEDLEINFMYPRPQNIPNPGFIKIDRSLIHPSLLGLNKEKNPENATNKANQDDGNTVTKIMNDSENDFSDKNLPDEAKKEAKGEVEDEGNPPKIKGVPVDKNDKA